MECKKLRDQIGVELGCSPPVWVGGDCATRPPHMMTTAMKESAYPHWWPGES